MLSKFSPIVHIFQWQYIRKSISLQNSSVHTLCTNLLLLEFLRLAPVFRTVSRVTTNALPLDDTGTLSALALVLDRDRGRWSGVPRYLPRDLEPREEDGREVMVVEEGRAFGRVTERRGRGRKVL